LAENAGIKSADTGKKHPFYSVKDKYKVILNLHQSFKKQCSYIDFQAQLKLADTLKKLSETAGNFRYFRILNKVPYRFKQ
jgi:hypothetical protein